MESYPYSQYEDEQLLELLRCSDKKAFTEIYDRYSEKIFAIAYVHCKLKELAEEIMQDVFMSLWERRDISNIKTLAAYLATAAKFAVFDQLQKNFRRRQILENRGELAIASFSEELTINARFLKNYIADAVNALPEKCRLVYCYSREEGMNVNEIAEKMNITQKAAENYLSRALKTLRVSLKNVRLLAWIML
jgi:RNA polymerase sigma-70 factor (ECF subfamily)